MNAVFPPLSPLFVVSLAAVMVAVLWWTWNLTMPELFHLPPLRFWQAFRLVVIATIIFGGALHFGLP